MSERRTHVRARVLIVDDHLSLAETLADGLAECGYEAIALSSSQEAAARLAAHESFDALITDLRMPGLDGLELLKISLAAAPDRPVIVMTAFSAVDSVVESLRQGAFHCLSKPFRLEELVLFLNRALGKPSPLNARQSC
ncbi:MAG TPA: response regulator [Polyangiaceae bacterium]